ncbi:MAG: oxidoreductase [Friedmanniella sp.]|nr:oxidoreductase [Friedmanniella sp.]
MESMTSTTLDRPAPPATRPVGTARRAPSPGAVGVRLLVLLGTAGVVGLWWAHSPSGASLTPGSALTSVAELGGMVDGLLICVQLLLVARVPWMERAVGQDWLVLWHRLLGVSVLLLTLSHVFLIIVGGALSDQATVWSEFFSTTLTQPDVLTATIGTVALLVVGLSSARLARRHLSYEVWYWLHTTTYVAVFLTFGHQINAGAHFVSHPYSQAAWTLLYLGTAAAVVVWRGVLPLRLVLRHRVRIERIVPESPGVASIWMRGRHLDELETRAGQFFLFRFLARGHLLSSHPYSVSWVPERDWVRITVGALGDHSAALHGLHPGTRVLLQGPFGRFTPERVQADRVLLVAGGVGIGPIRSLAVAFARAGRDVVVLHRAPSADDLPLAEELRSEPGVRLIPVLGHRSDLGYDPLAADRLLDLVPDLRHREVLLCGSPGLAAAVTATVRSLGVRSSRIHQEELSMS